MSKKIALIACCKTKLSCPAPVRELYCSQLFKLTLGHVETVGADDIYVLSAKHHDLTLDKVIAP